MNRIVLVALALVVSACASTVPEAASSAPGDCFMFQQVGTRKVVTTGSDCAAATAPASTFKIPHALIALETRRVELGEPIEFDRTDVPFESWRQEHDVVSGVRYSVYPLFRVVAGRIGRELMLEWLSRLQYARDMFEGDHTDFWTSGDLVVTPREQLDFMRRLASGDLPVSATSRLAVLSILVMPARIITNAAGTHSFDPGWPDRTIVRAKTGNTRTDGTRISWLVGSLERGSTQWVFVARVRSTGDLSSTAGAELAARELRKLAPR